MTLEKIEIKAMEKIGLGLNRPEDVAVSKEGRVWASDLESACAEILPDGSLNRVGHAGYGLNGQRLARSLAKTRTRYIIADLNIENVRDASRQGEPAYFGDLKSAFDPQSERSPAGDEEHQHRGTE